MYKQAYEPLPEPQPTEGEAEKDYLEYAEDEAARKLLFTAVCPVTRDSAHFYRIKN